MRRSRSSISYYRYQTGELDESVSRDTVVLSSSRQLGWDGAAAELGRSRSFEPTEVAVADHYLAMNVDRKPLPIEDRSNGKCRRVTLPPGSFQLFPANVPFTQRILKPAHFGAVGISPRKMQQLLGYELRLRPALGLVDEPLAAVVRTLLAEVARGGTSGPLFADSLLTAVVSRLATILDGSPAMPAATGALSAKRLARVTESIDDRIGERLTVEDLATVAKLSPAHFAREFKRCTHETPHAFVTRRRLERARMEMLAGKSIAEVAGELGFCDQPHLSRLFKRRFGVTPGAFVRGARRRPLRRR